MSHGRSPSVRLAGTIPLFDAIDEIAMLLSLIYIVGLQVHMLAAGKSCQRNGSCKTPNCFSMK